MYNILYNVQYIIKCTIYYKMYNILHDVQYIIQCTIYYTMSGFVDIWIDK